MIQLNKIQTAYFGKIHTEIGKYFDLNNDFFYKKFYNTAITDINLFNRIIKEQVKERKLNEL